MGRWSPLGGGAESHPKRPGICVVDPRSQGTVLGSEGESQTDAGRRCWVKREDPFKTGEAGVCRSTLEAQGRRVSEGPANALREKEPRESELFLRD